MEAGLKQKPQPSDLPTLWAELQDEAFQPSNFFPIIFPHLQKETALREQGYRFIAGLDEAGRGAWAGPVVAAAVILPLDQPDLAQVLVGLDDSKKLNAFEREHFFEMIQATAVAMSVGLAPAELVDEINVVRATRCAMEQALSRLAIVPDYLLIDHLKLPAVNLPQDAFPKADGISLTVAAASVIAKVTRDHLMVQYGQEYPAYAFHRHKGYGTAAHRIALTEHGPCPLHRKSYEPVRATIHPAAALMSPCHTLLDSPQ